jgi:probable rRNA maturation factor
VTVDVDMIDATGLIVGGEAVKGLVRAVLEEEALEGEVEVAFVGEAAITELNERYRDVAGATDVLSFDYVAEVSWPEPDDGGPGGSRPVAGEIVVCPQVVARYAAEEGLEPAVQLGWTLIHGALHLAGYDHESDNGEMRERERVLLERLGERVRALAPAGSGE